MASYLKRKVKSGMVWDVRFRIIDKGAEVHKSLNGFRTKKEAENAYLIFKRDFKPVVKSVAEGITFADVCAAFKRYIGSRLKESSIDSYGRNIDKHLLPYFGEKPIEKITKHDIVAWQDEFRKNVYKHSFNQTVYGALVYVFNYAVEFLDLPFNPASKAKGFRNNDIEPPMLFWTEDEFKQFIAVVDDIVYKTAFSFLYLTGARRGEMLALTWNDVKGAAANINKACSFHNISDTTYIITSPKNASSRRIVLLPASLIELLDELHEHAKGFEGFAESGFIFFLNNPIPPETLRRKLRIYSEKAGVKLIRIHDFRHSHASLLINNGNNVLAVAQRLGHADVQQTLNRYSHFFDKEQAKIVESINISLK